ncbi:YwqJ-related putative deaminase [Glycomyces harbinensis]|uniref:YwqJ-like deaminase n=1 Tax=Glycomyces harbinensis TaxID=58114 RepID=A0A1G7BET8_9ACTN|nr:YwqJ-related putative deaminase [Glycomyces harbinensis]SDE24896.1 YwqJ-like deaminase [Glycomyces harbinensis]
MPKPKDGSKSGVSTVVNKVLSYPGSFRKPEPRGPSRSSDPDVQNLENKLDDIGREPKPRRWDYMEPTGDKNKDHEKLRERWNEYIDENPERWSNAKRMPCVSAVWDRKSGRVYYDHNVHKRDKWNMNPDDLDPILRERYKKSLDRNGPFWQMQENQDWHGAPGTHSETRATNQAIKDARNDPGREPFMEDFMLHNGNPKTKNDMRCCGNCTQMCDGVHGSKAGWEAGGPGGHQVDNNWSSDFSV